MMKALFLDEKDGIALREVARPQLEQDTDVVIRVTLTAICGSDLHSLHRGAIHSPGSEKIRGHEFVGVIDQVGTAVKRFKVGDRVLGICTIQCGHCPECNRGRPVYCHQAMRYSRHIDGAQAEYVRVPFADYSVEPIPAHLSDEDVLLVGDIFPTGFMGAQYGSIMPGDSVVVFGAGPVGLCALASAQLFGPAQTIAVDLLDYRLDKAKDMGADQVVNAAETDVVEAIKEMTRGQGADVCIEAVGSAVTLQGALASTVKGGHVSIVGLGHGPVEFPMQTMVHQGLTIRMGVVNVARLDRLMALIANGKVDLTPIITHRLPLSQIVEGYRLFDKKLDGCVKVAMHC